MLFDEGFTRMHDDLLSYDFLDFTDLKDYKSRLESAKAKTGFICYDINLSLLDIKAINDTIISQYHFISDFQKLQTTLRGPPSII